MKTKLLIKSFLVAVGLCAGVNAWAEDTSGKTVVGNTVTETYDFNGWGLAHLNSKATATIAKASETADHTIGETAVYEITNPVGNADATLELYHRFAMSNPGTDRRSQQVIFYNSDKNGNRVYFGGTAVTGYVSILDLPKDATITITTEGGNNTSFTFQSANVKDNEDNTVTAGTTTLTSDATYTVTTAGDVDFSHTTWAGWKKVVIVYEATEEVVSVPTLELTSTNGNNRTITVTDGASSNGEATVKTYYTTNGDTPNSSSTEVEGGEITVSTSCTIKAITISSTGGESPIAELAVEAGTPIVLNNPVISRTAETSVTITAPQSVLGTPVATIYYRIGDTGDFSVYSEALTVSSHNTVYAYAVATGYGNSETVQREIAFVSSFPQASVLNKVNTFTSGALNTSVDGIVGTNSTYYPLFIDEEQWGSNVYFQNTNVWGFRSNNTWYNNSASSSTGWIMFNNLKAGDVVVVRISEGANSLTNATYLPAYSYNGHHAYAANSDGNMELRFSRTADKGNNVLSGIDQYPNTTFTLASGEAQHLTFHNAGSGSANDDNWKINLYNAGNKVGEVRADWWDDVTGGNSNFTTPYLYSADGGITVGPDVWANYLTDMTNADIDFTVSYTGGTLYIIGTMTKDNDIYYVNYSKAGLAGNVSIYLYGKNATLSNINHVSTDVNTATVAPSNAVTATIGSTGWTTFASPYALDLSSITATEGEVKAYYASSVNAGKVRMISTDKNDVIAGEGLMFKGTPGAVVTIPVVASGTAVDGNLLVGCTTETVLPTNSNHYVLVNNGGNPEFQSLASHGATIPAGKAYLNAPTAGARLSIVFDDETTGIVNLPTANSKGEGAVYNLNGQRVQKAQKGLYIIDGKKVMVK